MKKMTLMLMFSLVFVLAGCNGSTKGYVQHEEEEKVSNETEQGVQENALTLQLLKGDEEAGVTIENNEVYKELNRLITENPDIGLEGDFSVYIVDIIDSGTEDASLLFLGINRLDEPLKEVSFDYTLGHTNGEFVWENAEVNLSEEEAGIILPNHAIPFSLGITPEQEAIIDTLDQDAQVVKIENFSFQSVE